MPMKPVYIQGIGIISRCAAAASELPRLVEDGSGWEIPQEKQLDFPLNAPAAKMRRVARYAQMAVSAASAARDDGKLPEDMDKSRVGTIFSTGFGAFDNCLAFAEDLTIGRPELSSPTQFTYAVANSSVGQFCIMNGYTGCSAVLTGGDPLEYAAMQLNLGRAEAVFCGAVEEYHTELERAVMGCGLLPEGISEGAAVLLLSSEPGSQETGYCKVQSLSLAALPACPYVHQVDIAEAAAAMREALAGYGGHQPEIVLSQQNGSYLDAAEKAALGDVFPRSVLIRGKRYFGETLGGGYLLNVALGAALIKAGRARSVLASGIDMHGNYLTAWLEV